MDGYRNFTTHPVHHIIQYRCHLDWDIKPACIFVHTETAYIGITSASALGMPLGSLIGGFLGETFTPVLAVIICSVSMMILSIYWLSSSVLRKLPDIDRVNLFNKRKCNRQVKCYSFRQLICYTFFLKNRTSMFHSITVFI